MSKFFVVCLILSSLLQFDAVLTSTTGHLCPPHDSISLLQFKTGILNLNSSSSSSFCDEHGQYSYPKMISWNKSSSDCCTWDGVICHEITGHIIGLDLSCSRLKGFIHHNSSLFRLSSLEKLNLAHNEFSFSKISPNIGRLSSLSDLNFSDTGFEGIIPSSELSHLSKLELLDLSGNENLHFSHNLVWNLSHVSVLCLNHVNIITNLPVNWSSQFLTYLDLGNTGLRGELPQSIFCLPGLEKLLLNGNKNLRVSLPKINSSSITTSSLKVLDLSGTKFNADGFIDDSILNFPLLKSLSLSDCGLTGSFPNSIANLTQIDELDLSVNEFTGDFSLVMSNLPANLDKINLNWNSFSGQLSSNIGNLTQLRLHLNFLSGTLPFTMSALPKLRILDLTGNAFDGPIPLWLFSSPLMIHLDLSHNCITGQIIEFTAKSLVEIDLTSNNLTGSIDFSVFKQLSKLEYLKLSNNKLSLKIEDKSNLSFPDLLYLGISSCEITKFPSFLINSKNIFFLDLSNNKLFGQIPYTIPWNPLRYLNLSHNSLSDLGPLYTLCCSGSLNSLPLIETLEILDLSSNNFGEYLPRSICSFKDLYVLDLSHNNFMGSIPKCYGGFSSVLQVLNLENNELEGVISMNFPKDNGLISLNLNGNSLQGALPRSLDNCKNLRVLNVGNNKITDAFPNLEYLTHLKVLILKSNRFFGSLSNDKNHFFFPRLHVFDLSCNEFNGTLPAELLKSFRAMKISNKIIAKASHFNNYKLHEGQLYRFPISFTTKGGVFQFNGIMTTLLAIDLSSNHFVGEIPEIIGNLNSLMVLNLSHNKFSGPIPSTIGKLCGLESLDLSFNLFEGMIPWQLADVTFLEILNLSQNHLVGPIPQGKQFNTFLKDSYSGNMGLCGFPLTIKCKERNVSLHPSQPSSYQHKKDSGFWCEFTWKELLIGDIFGTVFGCFIFYIGKPRWLLRNIEDICWYCFLLIVKRKNIYKEYAVKRN